MRTIALSVVLFCLFALYVLLSGGCVDLEPPQSIDSTHAADCEARARAGGSFNDQLWYACTYGIAVNGSDAGTGDAK